MMSLSLASLALVALLPAGVLGASGSGTSTRYWDCCKPSCAWPGKASVNAPALTCDKDDMPLSDFNTKSGCESGGLAFTCTNQSPWALNDLVSYGFAATAINGGSESSWCCACYALTFSSGKAKGKTMVVQSVNTGGDLSSNQFDLQIPGGGLGIFDGCLTEFGVTLPGARYGGVSSRSDCALMPTKLQAGCYWRFDWFMGSDNPTHTFTQVQCPDELVARTGCRRSDDASFPKFVMPGTTWDPPQATETAAAGAQCDSISWDVPKACPAGFTCSYINDYYSQCNPGLAPASSSTKSSSSSSSTSTSSTSPKPSSLITSSTPFPSSTSIKTTAFSTSSSTSKTVTPLTTSTSTTTPSPSAASTSTPSTAAITTGGKSSSTTVSTTTVVSGGTKVPLWGQCNGYNWPTQLACVDGAKCTSYNPYYWQCVQTQY